MKNKKLILIFTPLIISLLIAFVLSKTMKDRYEKILKISENPQRPIEVILVDSKYLLLKEKFKSFARRLNNEIYRSGNSSCVDIEELNNFLPVVISDDFGELKVEIISYDLDIINKCIDFITSYVNLQNERSISQINKLIKINFNTLIPINITSQDLLNAFLEIEKTFKENDTNKKNMELSALGVLEYLKIKKTKMTKEYSDVEFNHLIIDYERTYKSQKLPFYLILIISYVAVFVLLFFLLQIKNNQKKIYKILNRILS